MTIMCFVPYNYFIFMLFCIWNNAKKKYILLKYMRVF